MGGGDCLLLIVARSLRLQTSTNDSTKGETALPCPPIRRVDCSQLEQMQQLLHPGCSLLFQTVAPVLLIMCRYNVKGPPSFFCSARLATLRHALNIPRHLRLCYSLSPPSLPLSHGCCSTHCWIKAGSAANRPIFPPCQTQHASSAKTTNTTLGSQKGAVQKAARTYALRQPKACYSGVAPLASSDMCSAPRSCVEPGAGLGMHSTQSAGCSAQGFCCPPHTQFY